MKVLTAEQARRLKEIGSALNDQWDVGAIVNDRYKWLEEEKPEGVFKYHVNIVIARLVNLSPGRVAKLASIEAMFPPEIRSQFDWGFGYWERAYDKGFEEGVQFIKFLDWYVKEDGNEQPDIETAMFLYNKHIRFYFIHDGSEVRIS